MVISEKIPDIFHIPRFRLTSVSEACILCEKCSNQCPMSLDVREMVKTSSKDSTEYNSCLGCVDVCPKKAIRCGIHRK